mmetsp:Transcript_63653/g.170386  ORF Transcript_63653/g.170386 Transcript_63653/m.170386 type:complete len:262 (-) Transcript_63653:3201-3986(-)
MDSTSFSATCSSFIDVLVTSNGMYGLCILSRSLACRPTRAAKDCKRERALVILAADHSVLGCQSASAVAGFGSCASGDVFGGTFSLDCASASLITLLMRLLARLNALSLSLICAWSVRGLSVSSAAHRASHAFQSASSACAAPSNIVKCWNSKLSTDERHCDSFCCFWTFSSCASSFCLSKTACGFRRSCVIREVKSLILGSVSSLSSFSMSSILRSSFDVESLTCNCFLELALTSLSLRITASLVNNFARDLANIVELNP